MDNKLKLMVLVASTRPGRVGTPVGKWMHAAATKHAKFDAELVELADMGLPIFDEPNHPRMQKYQHEHTKKWAAKVDPCDAYVFVCPEYNFGPTPALLNALDYLYLEWTQKPAGFVSYGGISGGLRGVQMAKLTLTTLNMMPIVDAVTIPNVFPLLADGPGGKVFNANEQHEKSAVAMLDSLMKWGTALKTMRAK